jgi:hypothetical protein
MEDDCREEQVNRQSFMISTKCPIKHKMKDKTIRNTFYRSYGLS